MEVKLYLIVLERGQTIKRTEVLYSFQQMLDEKYLKNELALKAKEYLFMFFGLSSLSKHYSLDDLKKIKV